MYLQVSMTTSAGLASILQMYNMRIVKLWNLEMQHTGIITYLLWIHYKKEQYNTTKA